MRCGALAGMAMVVPLASLAMSGCVAVGAVVVDPHPETRTRPTSRETSQRETRRALPDTMWCSFSCGRQAHHWRQAPRSKNAFAPSLWRGNRRRSLAAGARVKPPPLEREGVADSHVGPVSWLLGRA